MDDGAQWLLQLDDYSNNTSLAYERHVESLCIPFRESFTKKGQLLPWATLASLAYYATTTSNGLSVACMSCVKYKIPSSIDDLCEVPPVENTVTISISC